MLCFALAIAVLAAGISHVLTMKYSYARHDRAFREIPAIAFPTDAESKMVRTRYKMRSGWFTTEDFLTGIGISTFIALVLASNGWSHHRRLQHGQADSIINLFSRILAWFLGGALILGLLGH